MSRANEPTQQEVFARIKPKVHIGTAGQDHGIIFLKFCTYKSPRNQTIIHEADKTGPKSTLV
jgi:hypothetical protein